MKNKGIVITLIVLAVVVIIFAGLNKDTVDPTLKENAELSLKVNSEEVSRINLEEIEKMNVVDYQAILKRSGKEGKEHTYTGVLLNDILMDADIKVEENDTVILKSEDGYTVSITGSKVLEEDNVYASFKMDGEYLKPKEEDGSGPIQVVISKDKFSQYWSKYCIEVDVVNE